MPNAQNLDSVQNLLYLGDVQAGVREGLVVMIITIISAAVGCRETFTGRSSIWEYDFGICSKIPGSFLGTLIVLYVSRNLLHLCYDSV